MQRRMQIVAGALMAFAVGFLVSEGVSQETGAAPPEMSMEEMMAKWEAMNAKGPEHERFKNMVGTWKAESKSWMAPGTEPMVSEGRAVFKLILDGRYLQQDYSGEMMGQPFTGISVEGFDRIKKKYVSTWMDSSSTGIYIQYGTQDPSGKSFTYHGKMDDPFTGQEKTARSVAREIDKDTAVFEMYDTTPDGTEYKCMEITYKRVK